MAAKDAQSTPSVADGVVKARPRRRIPPVSKVRTVLRSCLKKNDFKLVEAMATYFKLGELECDYASMSLLAECFEKMGHTKNANRCKALAKQVMKRTPSNTGNENGELSPEAGRVEYTISPVKEPKPQQHSVMVPDIRKEEEVKMEPLDPIDYAGQLHDILDKPSLTEEVIVSCAQKPTYELSENIAQTAVTVTVRALLNPPPQHKDIGRFLTARGEARITRKDAPSRDRAFQNAKNRAAKQAIDRLSEMCRKINDDARRRLQNSLDDWIDGVRKDEYVDKWHHGYQRARNLIFGSSHAALYSARVFAYGSATTGLVLSDSDIDVAVALPMPKREEATRNQQVDILAFLQKKAGKCMAEVDLLASAKVPVLRYYDTEAKIDVDVTIANDSSVLLSRLLRNHLEGDVRIWELCMIVKYWAKRRRVSGASHRNINPMGWVIMVIYFLQHHISPPIASLYRTVGNDSSDAIIERVPWTSSRSHGKSCAKTGELLLQFFKFFGYSIDFAKEAISINMQHPELIRTITGKNHDAPIFIEQPLKLRVNVVDYVRASNMDVVKTELRRAYALCKTSGKVSELFKVRQRTETDYLFDEH